MWTASHFCKLVTAQAERAPNIVFEYTNYMHSCELLTLPTSPSTIKTNQKLYIPREHFYSKWKKN
uniref:Uncharacterized protein n=1 Tax=Arion vulgaris TaxID=1028688 RepID=A0A0B6ZV85_9EUPU